MQDNSSETILRLLKAESSIDLIIKEVGDLLEQLGDAIHLRDYSRLDEICDVILKKVGWQGLREVLASSKLTFIDFRRPKQMKRRIARGRMRDAIVHILGLVPTNGIDSDMLEVFKDIEAKSLDNLRSAVAVPAIEALRRQILEKKNTFFMDTDKIAASSFAILVPEIIRARTDEIAEKKDAKKTADLLGTYYGYSILTAGAVLSATQSKAVPEVVQALENTMAALGNPAELRKTRPIIFDKVFDNCAPDTKEILVECARMSVNIGWKQVKGIIDGLGYLGDSRALEPMLEKMRSKIPEGEKARVAEALGTLGCREAVPEIMQLYRQAKGNKKRFLDALADIRSEESAEVLRGLIRDKKFAKTAIEGLGTMAWEPATDELAALLDEEMKSNTPIVESLVLSLARMGEPGLCALKKRSAAICRIASESIQPTVMFGLLTRLPGFGVMPIAREYVDAVDAALASAADEGKRFERELEDQRKTNDRWDYTRERKFLQNRPPSPISTVLAIVDQDEPIYDLGNSVLSLKSIKERIAQSLIYPHDAFNLIKAIPAFGNDLTFINAFVEWFLQWAQSHPSQTFPKVVDGRQSEGFVVHMQFIPKSPLLMRNKDFLGFVKERFKDLPAFIKEKDALGSISHPLSNIATIWTDKDVLAAAAVRIDLDCRENYWKAKIPDATLHDEVICRLVADHLARESAKAQVISSYSPLNPRLRKQIESSADACMGLLWLLPNGHSISSPIICDWFRKILPDTIRAARSIHRNSTDYGRVLIDHLIRWGVHRDTGVQSAIAEKYEDLGREMIALNNQFSSARALEQALALPAFRKTSAAIDLVRFLLANEKHIGPMVEVVSRSEFLATDDSILNLIKERISDQGVAKYAALIPALHDLPEVAEILGKAESPARKTDSRKADSKDFDALLSSDSPDDSALIDAVNDRMMDGAKRTDDIDIIAHMADQQTRSLLIDIAIQKLASIAADIPCIEGARPYGRGHAVSPKDLYYLLRIPEAHADRRVHAIVAKAIRDLRCTGILYQVLGLHPSVLNEKVVQNALMLKIPAAIHEIEYSWTAGYEGQANAILSVCCIPLWAQNEKIQQAVVDILLAFPYLEDYLENCSAIMEGLLHDKDRHEE